MLSELEQGQHSSRTITAGVGVNGLKEVLKKTFIILKFVIGEIIRMHLEIQAVITCLLDKSPSISLVQQLNWFSSEQFARTLNDRKAK